MNILSKQKFDTRDELKEWLEDLNFTVEYYGGTSGDRYTRIHYDLDETDTWIDVPIDRFVNNNRYCYAIVLYKNGILISNGTSMRSSFYAAIAPENDGDAWICQASWDDDQIGDLFVSENVPNSGLVFSHDSIKLDQYYDKFTEEITPNKYYMIIMPYRNMGWVYLNGYQDWRRLSSHIPMYYGNLEYSPGQIVEVTINEKTFLLIIKSSYKTPLNTSGIGDSYNGIKYSIALRLP